MPPNDFVMWMWFLWPFIAFLIIVVYQIIKKSRFKKTPKIHHQENKLFCPSCGTPVNIEIGICPNCNRKV